MAHWTDNCIGVYVPYHDSKWHTNYFDVKDVIKGQPTYSIVPNKPTKSRTCQSCGCMYSHSAQIQRHVAYEPNSGKHKGKLLWKHDGWIKTGSSDTPSIDNSHNDAFRRLVSDNLPFIASFYHYKNFIIAEGADNKERVMEVLRHTRTKDMHLYERYQGCNSFYIWQPSQWTVVNNRTNKAISALEEL